MSKTWRTILACAMAATAGLLAAVVSSRITMTYELPPMPGADHPSLHTETFGPAVAATVACGVASLMLVGWIGWNVRSAPARPAWLVATLVLVAAVVAFGYGATSPFPTF